MCRPRGPRGSRSGTSEGSLPVHVLSVTQSPSGGRRAAARSHAHPKCKTRPHIPGRPKGTGRGEKRPPPAPTPALPSRSFQSVGGLYGVGHTRPNGQQPQQTLSGCTGQGAWQVVTEAVPGRGGGGTRHEKGLRAGPGWAFPVRPRVSQGAEVRERGSRVGDLLADKSLWPR